MGWKNIEDGVDHHCGGPEASKMVELEAMKDCDFEKNKKRTKGPQSPRSRFGLINDEPITTKAKGTNFMVRLFGETGSQ